MKENRTPTHYLRNLQTPNITSITIHYQKHLERPLTHHTFTTKAKLIPCQKTFLEMFQVCYLPMKVLTFRNAPASKHVEDRSRGEAA